MRRSPADKKAKREARLARKAKFAEENGPFRRLYRRDHDKYGAARLQEARNG